MRKRKSPVVLATILVIMLVAVGIIYAPRGGDGHDHEQVAQQPPPPTAEKGERPKISSKDVASMASSSMGGQATSARMMTPDGDTPSNKPSIAMAPQTQHKQEPNDATTSTQWYTDETKK
jgi:hypothetical protein